MAKTIGNPLSWTARMLGGAAEHVGTNIEHLGKDHSPLTADEITIRDLSLDDLREALRKGVEDLGASRTDAIFIVLIYPIVGLALATFGLDLSRLPLLFPLIAGFALLGPLAAVGLYEISRRREQGRPAGWNNALGVIGAPNFGAVLMLGLYLLAIFVFWMACAYLIYIYTLGPQPPTSITGFLSDVFTTGAGWAMILVGMSVGFVFALVVLAISIVSFPLILDKDVGVPTAVVTSVRVTQKNPREVLIWGAIVAVGLFLGSIPALVGLIIVLPILGHATWHLYRRAVEV